MNFTNLFAVLVRTYYLCLNKNNKKNLLKILFSLSCKEMDRKVATKCAVLWYKWTYNMMMGHAMNVLPPSFWDVLHSLLTLFWKRKLTTRTEDKLLFTMRAFMHHIINNSQISWWNRQPTFQLVIHSGHHQVLVRKEAINKKWTQKFVVPLRSCGGCEQIQILVLCVQLCTGFLCRNECRFPPLSGHARMV